MLFGERARSYCLVAVALATWGSVTCSPADGAVCDRGARQSCFGPAQCPGVQVCLDDGSGWGACACETADATAGTGAGASLGAGGDASVDASRDGSEGGVGGAAVDAAAGSGGVGGPDAPTPNDGGGTAGAAGTHTTGGTGGTPADSGTPRPILGVPNCDCYDYSAPPFPAPPDPLCDPCTYTFCDIRCDHGACTEGGRLPASCSECTLAVCRIQATCCSTGYFWTSECVDIARSLPACAAECSPPPMDAGPRPKPPECSRITFLFSPPALSPNLDFVVDDQRLYYWSGSRAYSKVQSGNFTNFSFANSAAKRLAVDRTHLYYLSGSLYGKIDKNSLNAFPTIGPTTARALQIDPPNVYWIADVGDDSFLYAAPNTSSVGTVLASASDLIQTFDPSCDNGIFARFLDVEVAAQWVYSILYYGRCVKVLRTPKSGGATVVALSYAGISGSLGESWNWSFRPTMKGIPGTPDIILHGNLDKSTVVRLNGSTLGTTTLLDRTDPHSIGSIGAEATHALAVHNQHALYQAALAGGEAQPVVSGSFTLVLATETSWYLAVEQPELEPPQGPLASVYRVQK